jgi:predicted metal-dependent phosphoesterase TrpH
MRNFPPHKSNDRKGRWFGEDTVRFDMHVHSCHSPDSALSVKNIVRSYNRHDILPLVCDHNTLAGSERTYAELRAQDPGIPCILAEEIMTADGEIIGLFLNEPAVPSLSAEETLDIIRDQGALSIIPHPFCSYRSSAIRSDVLERNIGRIDIIEGYNARVVNEDDNLLARIYAAQNAKPVSAGSDAHTFIELSRSYLTIEPFTSPSELLRNIRQAEVRFRRTHSSIHYLTQVIRLARQNGFVRI